MTASVTLPASYSTQSSDRGVRVPAQAEQLAVEVIRASHVRHRNADVVDALDADHDACLWVRRVPLVERQRVPVRVGEVRHVADARVERLAVELHALRLEPCARGGYVVDAKQDDAVRLRLKLDAELRRLPDREARISGPELEARVPVGPKRERLDVELPRPLGIRRRDSDDVDLADRTSRLGS